MNRPLTKVEFHCADGTVETLWAESVGPDLYRIDNCPFFQYGLSWNDVVMAPLGHDGHATFRRVHRKSGHRTVRVLTPADRDKSELLCEIHRLGCGYEGAFSRLVAIDVPPGASLEALCERLTCEGWQWEQADPPFECLRGGPGVD